jgi:copper chaperone CopZ
MRVAIHCQGCAGKVKKHISKMEGNIYTNSSLLFRLFLSLCKTAYVNK